MFIFHFCNKIKKASFEKNSNTVAISAQAEKKVSEKVNYSVPVSLKVHDNIRLVASGDYL